MCYCERCTARPWCLSVTKTPVTSLLRRSGEFLSRVYLLSTYQYRRSATLRALLLLSLCYTFRAGVLLCAPYFSRCQTVRHGARSRYATTTSARAAMARFAFDARAGARFRFATWISALSAAVTSATRHHRRHLLHSLRCPLHRRLRHHRRHRHRHLRHRQRRHRRPHRHHRRRLSRCLHRLRFLIAVPAATLPAA